MTVHIDPTGAEVRVPGSSGDPLPVDTPDPATVRLLSDGGAQATLFAGLGLNLLDWRPLVNGVAVQAMHCEPDAVAGGSPTRSGCPILFPFPNRIAGAQFEWEGTTITVPVAHPGDTNAIHGCCARVPWKSIHASGPSGVTGTFLISRDAPDDFSWPGDLELALTFDLTDTALRLSATVTNRGTSAAPFGMGYHPYFSLLGATSLDEMQLQVPAASRWQLVDGVPTGVQEPVTDEWDLHQSSPVGARVFDDVYTHLPSFSPGADGLQPRAQISGPELTLTLRCDAAWRDLVVFTPGHRQALAVEPYTCPSDAVHLTAAGLEVGWRVLQPQESWTGTVEIVASPPTL